MALRIFSDTDKILLGGFKLAAQDGELAVPCGTRAGAVAMRARAYALAKSIREDVEKQRHPELAEVNEWCMAISMTITDAGMLIMKRKDRASGLLALQGLLAAKGVGPVDPAQAELDKSLQRALDAAGTARAEPGPSLDPDAAPTLKNPYYTRDPR